jgi:hypothetical protein
LTLISSALRGGAPHENIRSCTWTVFRLWSFLFLDRRASNHSNTRISILEACIIHVKAEIKDAYSIISVAVLVLRRELIIWQSRMGSVLSFKGAI